MKGVAQTQISTAAGNSACIIQMTMSGDGASTSITTIQPFGNHRVPLQSGSIWWYLKKAWNCFMPVRRILRPCNIF
jgi:hypothetical protein